jgi:hypothetical protein
LDTNTVAHAAQAHVQIDLDGDGQTDIETLYQYWALDAAFGNWEQLGTPGIVSESGVWSDMNNGTVTIELWSSFGGDNIQYHIQDSYITVPLRNQ